MHPYVDVLGLAGLDRLVITLNDIVVLSPLPRRVYAWWTWSHPAEHNPAHVVPA